MNAALTRIAHACTLLELDGTRILTDPWFSEKPGYHQGETRPFATPADLPALDGIVVSHGHYDHFDLDAMAAYPDKTIPMIVKRGLHERATAAGWSNVVGLDAWEEARIGAIRVVATPAKHAVPEVGYVLVGGGKVVYFGADTCRIPELDGIAHRFPTIDLALLSINGLRIRPLLNRQVVMSLEEAAELTGTLQPRVAVPIHYAFTAGPVRERLLLKLDRRPEQFADAVHRHSPSTTVYVLPPGERLEF